MSDEAESCLEITLDKLITEVKRLADELKRHNDATIYTLSEEEAELYSRLGKGE